MKQKYKNSQRKSFHNQNPLVNYAPALENLQINSLKSRKGNLCSTGNIFLALNHAIIFLCIFYLFYSMFEISNSIISCEIYGTLSSFNLISCLLYILSSSFLIITVKQRKIEYYSKFIWTILFIFLLQTLKQLIYFLILQIFEEKSCISKFLSFDSSIMTYAIFLGISLFCLYFLRNLKVSIEGFFFFLNFLIFF